MSKSPYPLIISNAELAERRSNPNILILDVGAETTYAQHHILNAIYVPYNRIVMACPPVPGEIRPEAELKALFSELGITPDTWVVAYDDMDGAQAARLLWTLDLFDHPHLSLLDGGLRAWIGQGFQVTRLSSDKRTAVEFSTPMNQRAYANKQTVLEAIAQPNTLLWDARSPEEFSGEKLVGRFGGHIPKSVNLNWTLLWEETNFSKLKHRPLIAAQLEELGITKDKDIITYCQTHRRSALTYWVMKAMGYPSIKGYAGAWAEWGNNATTPKETLQ